MTFVQPLKDDVYICLFNLYLDPVRQVYDLTVLQVRKGSSKGLSNWPSQVSHYTSNVCKHDKG